MEHRPILPVSAPTDALHRLPGADLPLMPATIAARLLSRHSPHEIAEAIEVLVDVLDLLGGDPDMDTGDGEDEALSSHALTYASRGPGCPASDDGDISATEWHTRGRHKDNPGIHDARMLHEDDEEDDPAEDDDPREDDDPDHGIDDDPHDQEHDVESEQMQGDVPMLPVYSLDFNVFNDQRVPLGISNLQSSFVGQNIRSADTGAVHSHRRPALDRPQPGVPV